jgi:hypothetical protein
VPAGRRCQRPQVIGGQGGDLVAAQTATWAEVSEPACAVVSATMPSLVSAAI